MTPAAEVWASFSHDPRLGANAALRATDGDRDVVHQVLTDAYADGRLDREEFDTRTAQTAAARTLGELPPLLADLVAPAPLPSGGVLPVSAAVLRQRAVAKYRADRRDAFLGFLAPSFICLVIWLAFGAGALLLARLRHRRHRHQRAEHADPAREHHRREHPAPGEEAGEGTGPGSSSPGRPRTRAAPRQRSTDDSTDEDGTR